MSKNITSKITGTVTLTAGDNPVSVSSSGYVYGAPVGILGPAGTAWSIDNAGTIAGQGTLASGVSAGIMLGQGGTVTNEAGGQISGYDDGIYITGSNTGTVINGGTIAGHNDGVYIIGLASGSLINTGTIAGQQNGAVYFNTTGAVVTNAGTGQMSGLYGGLGFLSNTSGTLANYGTLTGVNGFGVELQDGGTITNGASGATVPALIYGGSYGITSLGAAVTITNFGSITSPGGAGVALGAGGSVTNGSSGASSSSIYGKSNGVVIDGAAAAITNFASIVGGSYGLKVKAGGSVVNAATGTIAGGLVGADASGVAATITNDGLISGGMFGVVFASALSATLTNAGTITDTGGTGKAVEFVGVTTSRVIVDPGAVFNGGVAGNGNVAASNNTLEFASGASVGTLAGLGSLVTNFGEIQFDSGAHWLVAGNAVGFSGTIGGFTLGDTIELSGITASYSSFNSGTLTLAKSGGGTVTLDITGTFPGQHFVANAVAAGTDVSLACFAEGTRIATERGMVAVEALREGDRVRTLLDGKLRPVVWLGHRRVDCMRHPDPVQVWPICVTADAFGPGRPYRDLWLSPSHAVLVDGVLIPVRHLLNGATIFQEARETVTYWHVELPEHAILSAEGVPAESYLDTGNRSAFENGGPVMDLHPDFALGVWTADGCAPLVLEGPRLGAAKRRLLERACMRGYVMTDEPDLRVLADGVAVALVGAGLMRRARLPAMTRSVRLRSRVWSPAHVRCDTDDLRPLGVAVAQVWLDRQEIALDDPALVSGWHAREPDWRWTDGDAALAVGRARELTIRLAMSGTYWREADEGTRRAAA